MYVRTIVVIFLADGILKKLTCVLEKYELCMIVFVKQGRQGERGERGASGPQGLQVSDTTGLQILMLLWCCQRQLKIDFKIDFYNCSIL